MKATYGVIGAVVGVLIVRSLIGSTSPDGQTRSA
jgi:hypothetical protein